ncbi:class II aldolase/adducin family protein [Marinimicrobium agarilyticum]|uniref:class II aldolase/adducin family protein n=1 Tax=Marinimicrobium agarilyticum TaxID=306546 RepID=UPI0004018A31|nr:class II aldolase/adducin family protein [Marinimicrobium agarilyticum]
MQGRENHYTHVQYAWDDDFARQLSPLDALIYRSNTLGGDPRITLTEGGSTSVKVMEKDPATGKLVEIIWVKGSGQDLRGSKAQHFLPLYQDKLVALRDAYNQHRQSATNREAEEAVMGQIRASVFQPSDFSPSTDTALHAFMPYAHVTHTHPSAALAVGASKNARALTEKIWGNDLIWLPRQRPGFKLGLQLQEAWSSHPDAKGALLSGNGVATWSDDSKACYQQTLELIERASQYVAARDKGESTFGGQRYTALSDADRQTLLADILMLLRELVSDQSPAVATIKSGAKILQFVNSADAPRLARERVACAHHLRRTKPNPLYVEWDPNNGTADELKRRLTEGVHQYIRAYTDYYNAFKRGISPAMASPMPTVCLIPGVGMITWGRTQVESRIVAESYLNAIDIMRGAEAIDAYEGLPARDAFDIEYGCFR